MCSRCTAVNIGITIEFSPRDKVKQCKENSSDEWPGVGTVSDCGICSNQANLSCVLPQIFASNQLNDCKSNSGGVCALSFLFNRFNV